MISFQAKDSVSSEDELPEVPFLREAAAAVEVRKLKVYEVPVHVNTVEMFVMSIVSFHVYTKGSYYVIAPIVCPSIHLSIC